MLQKICLLILFGVTFLSGAQSDLQRKIEQLQQVPKAQRFKLMNEIKRELAKMNVQQRKAALGKLRASMSHGSGHANGMHRKGGMGQGMHRDMQMHEEMQKRHTNPMRYGNGQRGEEQRPAQQNRPTHQGNPHGK